MSRPISLGVHLSVWLCMVFLALCSPIPAQEYVFDQAMVLGGFAGGIAAVDDQSCVAATYVSGRLELWSQGDRVTSTTKWINPENASDVVTLSNDLAGGPRGVDRDTTGLIYLVSPAPEVNLLVFDASLQSTPYRLQFNQSSADRGVVFDVKVDSAGRVFVMHIATFPAGKHRVQIYPPVAQWDSDHVMDPIGWVDYDNASTPMDLENFHAGMAVSDEGDIIWISDRLARRVVRFSGSPTSGYVQDAGFVLDLPDGSPSAPYDGFQGMDYDAATDTLFVTDALDNLILLVNGTTGAIKSSFSCGAQGHSDPLDVDYGPGDILFVAHEVDGIIERYVPGAPSSVSDWVLIYY